MATATIEAYGGISQKEYQRRIWAWSMYDWANSAFATTILAAVLPIYFSQVAGATLPSAAIATSYWSAGLFVSLLLIAIVSPVLGTISDIMRGKKLFLAIFAGVGILGTALLVLVTTGDWILASILAIIGRIGFSGANTFYDALLPHVCGEKEQDRVSARGYAMGYLGGGLLLAINIVMIQLLPGTWGPRLSFLSVAIWWAVFSVPLFRYVPEPKTATARLLPGENVVVASFKRIKETIRDIRQYRELFKYLVAFLIYNDGIGTIIGVAAIYGAELGFGSTELVLALLLVQFVGIPYSLIFGRLPSEGDRRRPLYLGFILFNLAALPLVGIAGSRFLPAETSGAHAAPYASTGSAVGQGVYPAGQSAITYFGDWQTTLIPGEELSPGGILGFLNNPFGGTMPDAVYRISTDPGASYQVVFNGQEVVITYSSGPEHGRWMVELNGLPYLDEETRAPLLIDAYNPTIRYGVRQAVTAAQPGEHIISLTNTGTRNPASAGNLITLNQVEVSPPTRQSNLGLIIAALFGLELIGLTLALLLGRPLFSGLAQNMNTQRSILLALSIYAVIAIWGYFLDSVIEFWFLAWMVAVVQGGSQALSRSLYAGMSPASKSGEFFGLYGVMEKFSAIIGPLLFAAAGIVFGSSRPAVLSLIVLFILGGFLLTRVNVAEGKRVAQQEDARLTGGE